LVWKINFLLKLILPAALLFSCGLEDYIFLEPVDIAYATGTNSAIIVLSPTNSASPNDEYFRFYTIYYRIYISDRDLSGIVSGQMFDVNPALASHYNTLAPYTTNDNVSPNAIGSVFSSLRYHPLYLSLNKTAPIDLYQILGRQSYTGTAPPVPAPWPPTPQPWNISLDFTDSAEGPFMTLSYDTLSSRRLYLFRSSGFTSSPPDRLFFNTTGSGSITDATIISNTVNADVEPKSGLSDAITTRYTYVSMYILAAGIDQNYTQIFSRPKHIGIFRLP
jgi:hypothetical protein